MKRLAVSMIIERNLHMLSDMIESIREEVIDRLYDCQMVSPVDDLPLYDGQYEEYEIEEYCKDMVLNILCGHIKMIDIEDDFCRSNFSYYYRKFLIRLKEIIGLERAVRFNFTVIRNKLIGIRNVKHIKKIHSINNPNRNIQSTNRTSYCDG